MGAFAAADRERRDLVSRQVMEEARLIRFVAGPDGSVVPDLARRLPGRGLWVAADRAAVKEAAATNLFARAAKVPLKPAADLADQVEALLVRRVLEQLGLARREGLLVPGFDSCAQALRGGRVAWMVEASDGARDGRDKLLRLARHQTPPPGVCGAFDARDLGLALGLENAIHAVLLKGGRAGLWGLELRRLAGFRPIVPAGWALAPTAREDREPTAEADGRGPAS